MEQLLALAMVFSPASSLTTALGLAVITPPMAPDAARNRNTKQLHI
jgi:hypothetical protein